MTSSTNSAGGKLTTHVLDTMNGCPGAAMQVALFRLEEKGEQLLNEFVLNDDGRSASGPILEGGQFQAGRYRLVFNVGQYFRDREAVLPEPTFLELVPIEFGIADPGVHYHVPLLVSPWSYSTYRGS